MEKKEKEEQLTADDESGKGHSDNSPKGSGSAFYLRKAIKSHLTASSAEELTPSPNDLSS